MTGHFDLEQLDVVVIFPSQWLQYPLVRADDCLQTNRIYSVFDHFPFKVSSDRK